VGVSLVVIAHAFGVALDWTEGALVLLTALRSYWSARRARTAAITSPYSGGPPGAPPGAPPPPGAIKVSDG